MMRIKISPLNKSDYSFVDGSLSKLGEYLREVHKYGPLRGLEGEEYRVFNCPVEARRNPTL